MEYLKFGMAIGMGSSLGLLVVIVVCEAVKSIFKDKEPMYSRVKPGQTWERKGITFSVTSYVDKKGKVSGSMSTGGQIPAVLTDIELYASDIQADWTLYDKKTDIEISPGQVWDRGSETFRVTQRVDDKGFVKGMFDASSPSQIAYGAKLRDSDLRANWELRYGAERR